MSPCSCTSRPVVSSREREPGASHVHVTDARGEWCAVRVGERVYRQALVKPSAEEDAARNAEASSSRQAASSPLEELRAELRARGVL